MAQSWRDVKLISKNFRLFSKFRCFYRSQIAIFVMNKLRTS